jgi:hypothetical protein
MHAQVYWVFFPSGFPAKILYHFLMSHMRSRSSAYLILLNLITFVIFGEEYKL